MREPAFWQRSGSLLSRGLKPLAAIYGHIAGKRMSRSGARVGIPVICVGNFHAGGAGKTPTVLALVELLRKNGELPVVLSRGYGGSEKGPLRVDVSSHTAKDVGDEPLMMARSCIVVIARDRVAGAKLAHDEGASVIVMDDGFQNPAVAKDLNLIVVDSYRSIGNGLVMPAGPLRAPLDKQMPFADALMVIGDGKKADALAAQFTATDRPVFRAHLNPLAAALDALSDKPVLAFAGIGDPQKFLRTLRANNINVKSTAWYPDHHFYNQAEIASLQGIAKRDELTLVTTEKDYTRIRHLPAAADIIPVVVTMMTDDPASLATYIGGRLAAARAK